MHNGRLELCNGRLKLLYYSLRDVITVIIEVVDLWSSVSVCAFTLTVQKSSLKFFFFFFCDIHAVTIIQRSLFSYRLNDTCIVFNIAEVLDKFISQNIASGVKAVNLVL